MRLILCRALVAMYRALCALTLHRWHYYRNVHGGKPLFRSCVHCGKRQTWNYDTARCRGRIEWVDYGNANDDPDPVESELAKLLRDSPPPAAWLDCFGKPHRCRQDAINDIGYEPEPLYRRADAPGVAVTGHQTFSHQVLMPPGEQEK